MHPLPASRSMHISFLVLIVYLKCLLHIVELQPVESASFSIITDKEALISFKSQLSLESPSLVSSWNPDDSSPCNWTGVICNRQRVSGLDLSGLGLEGSISPHIGNLSFLRSLQLQNNQLRGPVPPQITNIFRLRVVNLSSNLLEGEIPRNISNLAELEVFDLMANKISGRIPEELSRLRKLQVLNLARNLLWGEIPPSIANISSLNNVNFGTNNLTGSIPSDLSRLQNLKYLDLTINHLTGFVPYSIYNMSSLVYLALAANNLWGKLPTDIADTLPNLLGFNFCFNQFTGTIPGSLHNLTNIQIIRMAHNFLEGTVPPGLENLPFLKMYNIGFNKIVSSGDDGLALITSLTNSTRLNFLAIDGNLLEGVIPESVGNLSTELSKLYMGGNRIYGKIPTSIGRLRSLTLLNLSNNALSGEIPAEIGRLEELQFLGLAGNQISGGYPNSISNLKKLNQIDLSGNRLEGEIPSTFGNFRSLLSMDLSNNRLNRSIPKEILNLPSLSSILNLSRNFLDGQLPQQVGLENVVTIDLSNNRLSGDIPSSIKNCKSLEKLLLANNILSGPIPGTIGEVKGLEVLDLSLNQLSGSIPSDLQNLQALQSLNLTFNDLQGVIPTGGVFRNFSNVHLEGNVKLCLHSVCPENSRSHGRLVRIYIIATTVAAAAVVLLVSMLVLIRKNKGKVIGGSELYIKKPQMISYEELSRATGNFNQENLLGSGSFGSVYKGFLREGISIAVKVFDSEKTGSLKSFVAECEALRNVRHRNLVKLLTSCSSLNFRNDEFLALVYEFLSNGSLGDWIHGKRKNEDGIGLNVMERLNIIIDVACALDYLHHDSEIPIVHCDLKPTNILLNEDMTAKVGDFGLARLLMERRGNQSASISSTHVLKGSIGYIPPEYGFGEKPSTAGDVYSFGVMLLETFTGKHPTHENFNGEVSLVKWVEAAFPKKVQQVLDPELQHIYPEIPLDCLITIIGVGLSCTTHSPDGRISIRDALRDLKSAKNTLLKLVPLRKN